MASETPIKQILSNQAESYNYNNFFTQPISPSMISPWNDSSKKKNFSNLRDHDLRRLSDFRQKYSKKNSSAYRSIMQLQKDSYQKDNSSIDDNNLEGLQLQTQFQLHSMQKKQQQNQKESSDLGNIKKSKHHQNKFKKSYTQEDNFQKFKCKWNEWKEYDYDQEEYDKSDEKKMFQTLSTLNKRQMNVINNSSEKSTMKKIGINRKKLQTTVIDINQNTDFNPNKKRCKDKQFVQKNQQTIKGFYKLNKKCDLSQKNPVKNSNKKTKLNQRRFFNKFYFDFSVFGFKKSKSMNKINAQENHEKTEQQQIKRDHHFNYSLDLQKHQNIQRNLIKIRQLPKKLKSNNSESKRTTFKIVNQSQLKRNRRCKTVQKAVKGQNKTGQMQNMQIQQIDEKIYNKIHQGSIVINLNKMLQQEVRPMPTLNNMTQSSIYRKLRKTLCF